MRTERTALLTGEPTPNYAFESSIAQRRKKQVRQFQICLCSIFIFLLILGLVVSTTLSINDGNTNNTTENISVPLNQLFLIPGLIPCNVSVKYFNNSKEYFKAIDGSRKELRKLKKNEAENPILEINSPSYRHQMVTASSNKSKEFSLVGYMEEIATRKLLANQTSSICLKLLQKTNCTAYNKYRSYNGTCNNLKNPLTFGVAYTPFRRILPANYSDGISAPKSGQNSTLPSPRTISNIVHRPYFINDPKFTVMLAVFGQFLDHDITATAASRGRNNEPISCCQSGEKHPECFPVLIDQKDPYYSYHNISCMNFVRSAPALRTCLGPREQMNQVSAFIDGSVVYGTNDDLVMDLRTLENGTMKVFVTPDNRSLLPVSKNLMDGCNRADQEKIGRYCFLSGDSRANENVHLTTMHLIWTRHHNNLAKELKMVNVHWNDEKIFQEVRKILVAQFQHIAYNEFLRVVIGDKLMGKYDLLPKKKGYFQHYNDTIDPTIANSFATAAFRFAHSLIPTLVSFISKDTSSIEYVKLHEILFDPFLLYNPGELDKILKGAIHTQIQANDPYFTPELKEHLFERIDENLNTTRICGLDLVSLNLQRGRDHGLPGYAKWREICSLSKPSTFDNLRSSIDENTLAYIASVYRTVDDVDLYTGALSETPKDGSMLGPTLNCLIIDQFLRLKIADRFWYENPGVFTENQLNEIRKSTLAKILCDNSDGVEEIQPFVMENVGRDNKEVKCKDLQKTGLQHWQELGRVAVHNQGMAVQHKSPTSGAIPSDTQT